MSSEAFSSLRYILAGLCTDSGLLDFGNQPVERQMYVARKRGENNGSFLCLGEPADQMQAGFVSGKKTCRKHEMGKKGNSACRTSTYLHNTSSILNKLFTQLLVKPPNNQTKPQTIWHGGFTLFGMLLLRSHKNRQKGPRVPRD